MASKRWVLPYSNLERNIVDVGVHSNVLVCLTDLLLVQALDVSNCVVVDLMQDR